MAMANVHRFTTDEFLAIDGLPRRVELLDGVIYDMSPEGNMHALAQAAILRALMDALPEHQVLAGGSVNVTTAFCPIPDVAVYAPGTVGDGPAFDGQDALLIVEVGVSTAWADQHRKLPSYATGGVTEVWLVAPEANRMTCYRTPTDGDYAEEQKLSWPEGLGVAVTTLVASLAP